MVVLNRIHIGCCHYNSDIPNFGSVSSSGEKYVEEVADGSVEEVLPAYGTVAMNRLVSDRRSYELPLPTAKALVFTNILFNQEPYIQQHVRP